MSSFRCLTIALCSATAFVWMVLGPAAAGAAFGPQELDRVMARAAAGGAMKGARDGGRHLSDPGPAKEVRRAGEYGIKEVVPAEFRERYSRWKSELLSTEFGRRQWEAYENDRGFLLKIVVDPAHKFGGGTDDYEWDSKGRLIGATITLGKNLDRGYPDPVYYPVMNSLSNYNATYEISGSILASTKIAHELGHVNFTAKTTGEVFRRQDSLMAAYNRIFLRNGYNTRDPRLVALASELGAKPIEIWEDREYWSEANALQYLIERINKEDFYCSVVGRIRRNLSDHALNYQDRFVLAGGGGLDSGCSN